MGVLAHDGAVIAADRAVTFGTSMKGVFTVKDSHKKIVIVGQKVVVASTGQVGMGQRFAACVKKAWDGKKFAGERVDIATVLAREAQTDFVSSGANRGEYGALVAAASPLMLVEYAIADMQPELKTAEICYAAMGSGQLLADPYLALVRRVIWPGGQPNIEQATLAAVWVIKNAIMAAPGFIALPIDVAVIRKWPDSKGELVARMLTDGQVDQHLENAGRVNDQLRDAFIPQESIAPPSIPQPRPV